MLWDVFPYNARGAYVLFLLAFRPLFPCNLQLAVALNRYYFSTKGKALSTIVADQLQVPDQSDPQASSSASFP